MRKAEVAALPPFVNLQQRIDEIMGMFLSAVATDLSPEELNIEKKHMVKIGRLGVSDRAVFLSSLMLDRSRYVLFTDMNRDRKSGG